MIYCKYFLISINKGNFDVIVIGGGINGSYAALQLAKKGKRTALVEQFPLPHSRGSSGGQSRVIRTANYGVFPLTQIMRDSQEQWKDLQIETKTNLLRERSMMTMAKKCDRIDIDKMHDAIKECNEIPKWWHVKEFNDKFGTNFSEDYLILEDATAGILMADQCLLTVQQKFISLGGRIIDEFPVCKIRIQTDSSVIVKGKNKSFTSSALIICAGSWTHRLLQPLGVDLPLKVVKVGVFYWPIEDHTKETISFYESNIRPGEHIYGLPQIEYSGMVKICLHNGPIIDPDKRELSDLTKIKEEISDYILLRFPYLGPVPAIEESCIYTNSPDKEMIIDQLEGHPNIAYAAGFSGSGFKTAPTVGNILSELVLGMEPSFSIENFRCKRFVNNGISKL